MKIWFQIVLCAWLLIAEDSRTKVLGTYEVKADCEHERLLSLTRADKAKNKKIYDQLLASRCLPAGTTPK